MRPLLVTAPALLALVVAGPLPAVESQPATLVIAFDCLPYETVAALTNPAAGEQAVFEGLRPVPLISSFPSTTSVAFGGILQPFGLEISPGYEARFFDWQRRRVRGGMPWSYYRIGFDWREFFDWHRRSPVRRFLSAVRPRRSTLAWFRRGIDAFLRSDRDLFFIYNGATDTLAHLQGPQGFGPVLVELERMLERARRERPFHFVMFSDHGIAGGRPLRNVWRPVKRALAAAGFRYRRKLRVPEDVALTPFGLVSSFEIYVMPEVTARVARVVAGVDGVDLCVTRHEDGWTVSSGEGEARFERRAGERGIEWRYRPGDGDPLDLSGLADDGWREDRWWLEATARHSYPDALHRLARSFELVENPASIVCSVAPDHMFGGSKTAAGSRLTGSRLRWTHGALEKDASLGFLLTDLPGWQPAGALRFDQALAPLAERSGPNDH